MASRSEPRLMEILCLLAENQGQLVTREQLIKQVWNDYGGADEGLNQAISFLRKILGDHTKKIIETIPKKGYILHALITENIETPLPEEKITVTQIKSRGRRYGILALLIVLVIIILVSIYTLGRKDTNGSDIAPANQLITKPGVPKDSDNIQTSKKGSAGADLVPADQLNSNSGKNHSIDSGADVLRR